jgi:hypoxanthine phosphoribosyltransferase
VPGETPRSQPTPNVQGGTVILIDDGLATGSTMRAAATALRQMRPLKIIVAVPVAAPETCEDFAAKSMKSCAPQCLSRLWQLAHGMQSFPRRAMRKCAIYWHEPQALADMIRFTSMHVAEAL